VDDESYAIYSAILNQDPFVDDRASKRILISGETTPESDLEAACPTRLAKYDPAVRQAVEAYGRANQSTYLLESHFTLRKAYKLLDDSAWGVVFENKKDPSAVLKQLYALNPGARGIYSFSAVGFNLERTVAIVHVLFYCDWLCVESNRFVVRKIGGKWQSVEDLGCGGVS